MTWDVDHEAAQDHSSEAYVLMRKDRRAEAVAEYAKAAELEEAAFDQLDASLPRTLGIIAVSAAALWYKAGDYPRSASVAERALMNPALPDFAQDQLQEILDEVRPKGSAPRVKTA